MDGGNAGSPDSEGRLEPRPPNQGDLEILCRRLNELGAKYVVVGGFAIIASGLPRTTGDIDFLIETSLANEALVFKALELLQDQAVKELDPGDVAKFQVVRVIDEVIVDLMEAACGIGYEEASKDVVFRVIGGVRIPFVSPRMLWRMKAPTRREKDAGDLYFLREYFRSHGEQPPPI